MEYPNNFNVPAFPAGPTIALSRGVAIWIAIVFFLILCACGFIFLGFHFQTNYPFLISIDPLTTEWSVVTYPNQNKKTTVPQYQIIQEKLVRDYVNNWFTISGDNKINKSRWEKCSVEDCEAPNQFNPNNIECALYCSSGDEIFEQFTDKVLPEYKERIAQAHEKWTVKDMQILPTDVKEDSSQWQVIPIINSTISSDFVVLVFITIDRDLNLYPANLGYYVKDFNAYRINR